MVGNDEIVFVARASKYGGSNSLAAVLDRNACKYYGVEEGDLLQFRVSGIVKQKTSNSNKAAEEVPVVEADSKASSSENRKNAEVRYYDL